MIWTIIGVALFAISLFLEVRTNGLRRGLACWLDGIARAILIAGPLAAIEACVGRMAAWCALPFAFAAAVLGQTTLGMLNFVVLQWFCVRLARKMECTESDGTHVSVLGKDERSVDRVADIVAKRGTKPRWFLLRWVWPLTGWWSEYRWIRRSC